VLSPTKAFMQAKRHGLRQSQTEGRIPISKPILETSGYRKSPYSSKMGMPTGSLEFQTAMKPPLPLLLSVLIGKTYSLTDRRKMV
jgi:hypothetical protein